MKKFSVFLILVSMAVSAFSADDYLARANRKTAVRCLKLSESCLASRDYGNALNQSQIGLGYDSGISDLWYVQAVAKMALGEKKAEVLSLIKKSIYEGEWVDYNRDNARILYADILCDTDSWNEALEVLDAVPFIYSADSEFIRLKAYYRIGTDFYIKKAREKVDAARKIYPSDKRFAQLFFRHEYALKLNNGGKTYYGEKNYAEELVNGADGGEYGSFQESAEDLVQKIADSFIAKMPEYDNPDAELEIYAALFAQGEAQRRMLQAFTAHGMEHPLYAAAALRAGLLDQQEAWDYFCGFADNAVDLWMLNEILPLMTDDITRKSVYEHLNAFSGVLTDDTDGDLVPNLTAYYSRGRARMIQIDLNNDGIIEYSLECDFGVPVTIDINDQVLLTYGTYPSVIKAEYENPYGDGKIAYHLIDEELNWTPVFMEPLSSARITSGCDFYVPFYDGNIDVISEEDLRSFCSKYEIPTDERTNGHIVFSLLDGKIKSAEYYTGSRIFAHSVFENGMPYSRTVDKDDDGIFEVTEIYGYDPEGKIRMPENEEIQVMKNLSGKSLSGTGIYVKLIQIDSNCDTIPDFIEQYDTDGGKVTMWDTDADGEWDVRYRRFPKPAGQDSLYEDAQFYKMPDKVCVTINFVNSVPVKIIEDELEYSVTPGTLKGFYWVGESGNVDDETFIIKNYGSSFVQGKSEIIQNGNRRMNVVLVAEELYAEFLGETIEIEDNYFTGYTDLSTDLDSDYSGDY